MTTETKPLPMSGSTRPASRPTPNRPSRPGGISAFLNRHRKWVLAGPALIFVIGMLAFPLGWTLYLSLTDASGSVRADKAFIGLGNYLSVLTDTERFWPAAARTAFFTGGALALELVLGMIIALLLWRPFRAQGLVRVAILLPLVATPVAVGMMWLLIFEPTIGAANQVLRTLRLPVQGWISDPDQALPTLMLVDVWQWTPMVVLILLAGLTALPEEPQEAARVDGASAWQRFWFVTLPLLAPTVIAAILLRGIDALKTFDLLYATKGKGGGSANEVETLNLYAYGMGLDYNEYGISSAVLIIFFLMIIAVVGVLVLRRGKAVS